MQRWLNESFNCFLFKRNGRSSWYDIEGLSKWSSNQPFWSHLLTITLGYLTPESTKSFSHSSNTQNIPYSTPGVGKLWPYRLHPADFDCNYYMIANIQLYKIMPNCYQFNILTAVYITLFKLHLNTLHYQTFVIFANLGLENDIYYAFDY